MVDDSIANDNGNTPLFNYAIETRRAAHQAALPKMPQRCEKALEQLRRVGRHGMTRHQLADSINVPLQSICCVAKRLRDLGLAVEIGKRKTAAGASAAVLVAKEFCSVSSANRSEAASG